MKPTHTKQEPAQHSVNNMGRAIPPDRYVLEQSAKGSGSTLDLLYDIRDTADVHPGMRYLARGVTPAAAELIVVALNAYDPCWK